MERYLSNIVKVNFIKVKNLSLIFLFLELIISWINTKYVGLTKNLFFVFCCKL